VLSSTPNFPSCYAWGQFYTIDGKSLYDLSHYGFTNLNISEAIFFTGKKWTLELQFMS
jgi:hypothetical protein